MTRILLLIPSRTYRTADFIEAASALDIEVVVGMEERPAVADVMGERWLALSLTDVASGRQAIVDYAQEHPLDAVIPIDDGSTLVAAAGAAALGLPHNRFGAVAASRDKARTRELLAAAGLNTPRFRTWPADADPEEVPSPTFPVVVKPVDLSGSRGVIRADDPDELAGAFARVAAIVRSPDVCPPGEEPQRIVVEDFIPGVEVAVEGLLRGGRLEVLAIFDKPDPLVGPYFEETIYVTPSRLPAETQSLVEATAAAATRAIGLTEGPIHAELRLNEGGAWVLEVAARSIGGLCARTLHFGAGVPLEELIIRHAAGLPLPSLEREHAAAGVMMLPIPRAGTLREVNGRAEAIAVPGIEGLVITIPPGGRVVPLPEGDRYLGFMFARAETPAEVEAALREAHRRLEIVIE
ncbi:MAG: phosphoribosylglycinamide synthetase [Chloroflexi bacterium CSP1-4]|nr:MAG: phosphoribosylglycinamide synthetase [Chloroflexi bacterium CSP1-4]